ncbi:hypothetical protein PENTCL1PPCAC_18909 [Pristionchus entomophagus]|uniref:MPN domain-containing protein n=1 Tax=Pristionchus entomophagus TaxID=358040 RepID=A0AAV5TQN4_9BILA|nr:hypothetical protein PENTCL1PPCAC_18909 [Pristionchus entomophagus]
MDTSGPSSSAATAQQKFLAANNVKDLDAAFTYDEVEQNQIRSSRPWEKDAHYFKEVRISAVALIKMVMHARRGGNIEVMGLMQGRVDAHALIVTDSFALPVEGTETRVNAAEEANEYSVAYSLKCEEMGVKDKVIGWYHSHPGYGCWLSGIDVSTQSTNQQYTEPFVAIVIDPIKTMTTGKVEIGAFRTYPRGYKPPEDAKDEYQHIPLNKVEDFGAHFKSYYSLDVTFFKSSLDARILNSLWSTYWASTLSTSPLLSNATYIDEQMFDLAKKLKQIQGSLHRVGERANDATEKLDKAVLDAKMVGDELLNDLIVQNIKKSLFNRHPSGVSGGCCSNGAAALATPPAAEEEKMES